MTLRLIFVRRSGALRARQAGAATLEFAVSMLVFCVALMAVVEFARFMLVWNTAAEATRLASRLAALCNTGPAQETRIRARVKYFVEVSGQVQVGSRNDWLVLSYSPVGCTQTTCTLVEARLSQLQARLLVPVSQLVLALPAYRSTQVREVMNNDVAGEYNAACN